MSTYLELCQNMARDIGIPGTGPSDVNCFYSYQKKRMLLFAMLNKLI